MQLIIHWPIPPGLSLLVGQTLDEEAYLYYHLYWTGKGRAIPSVKFIPGAGEHRG